MTATLALVRNPETLSDGIRARMAEQPDVIPMSDALVQRIAGVLTGRPAPSDPTPDGFNNVQFDVLADLLDNRVRVEREHASELLANGFDDDESMDRLSEAADADASCVAAIIELLDWPTSPAAISRARGLIDETVERERARIRWLVAAAGGTLDDAQLVRSWYGLVDDNVALRRCA